MTQIGPGRYWIIRHQDQSKPQTVAKFDTAGATQIPDDVANHDTFQILEVSGQSNLVDQEVDHSVLSDDEKELLSQVYPVDGY